MQQTPAPTQAQQFQVPSITVKDTLGFSHAWRHKGVAIPMLDVHIQFATDWANIVLRNFVQQVAATKRAKEAAKPKIITEGVEG